MKARSVFQIIHELFERGRGRRHSLVVQFPTETWGTVADLEKRNWLADRLDQALRSKRNGECDGGDIGSGTINIFLTGVVDPGRACVTIVDTLRELGELSGAIVALDLDPEGEKEEDPFYTVLWPKEYDGEFSAI